MTVYGGHLQLTQMTDEDLQSMEKIVAMMGTADSDEDLAPASDEVLPTVQPSFVLPSGVSVDVDIANCSTVWEVKMRVAGILDVNPRHVKLLALTSESEELDSMATIDHLRNIASVQVVRSATAPRIFVADTGNFRICMWNEDTGTCEHVVSTGEPMDRDGRPLYHDNVVSFTIDHDGALIVADHRQSCMYRWRLDGSCRVVAGNDYYSLECPYGVCTDNRGAIYVAEASAQRVSRWLPGATVRETVTDGKGGRWMDGWRIDCKSLDRPVGVVVSGDGAVFVAEDSRVTRWLPGAESGEVVASKLSRSWGLCLDAEGALYVSEVEKHRVTRWAKGSKQGQVVAGGHGSGAGLHQLANPMGIFLDVEGNLFVADAGNHRVSCWAPGATVGKVVAGTGVPGSGPGQLNRPVDVSVG